MIIGNGIDIVEIDRIKAALERRPQLIFNVFTACERSYFEKRKNNAATIAGCFAAKEAAVKAVGGGFITNVELGWDENGKPSLKMKGKENIQFLVSISHSRGYAVANVIAMTC